MKELLRSVRADISFVVLAVVGLVGLFGQAAILRNALVDSYPFKMMNTPPSDFYASIGVWGYSVALVGGSVGLALSVRLKRHLTAALPVILGPLCYWLTFEGAHLVQNFSRGEITARNFEGYTGYAARYEFGYKVFSLMFIGTMVAIVAGLVITRIWKAEADALA